MLLESKVPEATCKLLGDNDVDSAALFGNLAKDDEQFLKFLKVALDVDPEARAKDFILAGRLRMVWEACKVRTVVEIKQQAERQMARLPPQLNIGDLETAKRAFESVTGIEIPKATDSSSRLAEIPQRRLADRQQSPHR